MEPETLHAVMRLCLRLTRDYEFAVLFAQFGGVHLLLHMNGDSVFPGFIGLCNLIIRHVIEDPSCLRYAIEKVRLLSHFLNVHSPYANRCFQMCQTLCAIKISLYARSLDDYHIYNSCVTFIVVLQCTDDSSQSAQHWCLNL